LDGEESPLVSASVLEPKLKVKELVFPVPTPEEHPNKKVPAAGFGSNENGLAADVLSVPKMLVTDEAVVDGEPNENPPFGIAESELVNKDEVIVVGVGVAEVDVFEMGIPKLYLTGSGVPPAVTPKVKSLCDGVPKLNSVPGDGIPNLNRGWFEEVAVFPFCVTSWPSFGLLQHTQHVLSESLCA